MSANDFESVSCATRRVLNTLAAATNWQIIEMHWNTVMQHNIIWSIAFEVLTKEILKEVC